jgi:hypothetical protein
MTERETLLAEIAEKQARLAELDAEPDYEAWRPALDAFYDARMVEGKSAIPFSKWDKNIIRYLIAALAKAPPMGKCPTCGKDYSDGLVCSDAFHLPAGTPTYWPTDEAPPTGPVMGEAEIEALAQKCAEDVYAYKDPEKAYAQNAARVAVRETLSRVQPRWPSEAELREMWESSLTWQGFANRIRAYQTGEQP